MRLHEITMFTQKYRTSSMHIILWNAMFILGLVSMCYVGSISISVAVDILYHIMPVFHHNGRREIKNLLEQ
jgi:hypothetical protein